MWIDRGLAGGVEYFLKCCFWHFPSEYDSSNRNEQFWSENGNNWGDNFPLDYPSPKEYF